MTDLSAQIKENPYNFICDFVESIYPFTGRYVFETLALVPCSLIINDLDYISTKIRTNINVFFLAESGGAKSSICKQFAKFTFFPVEGRSYTPAELENKIMRTQIFSLIIEDYATMSADERTNKIIEGIIGDEKILDRHTTTKDIRQHVEGVGLLCGVPQDLTNRMTSGNLSRVICIVKIHTDDEHSKIGKYIITNIGIKDGHKEKEEAIIDYYQLLQKIQAEEIKKYPPIKNFEISPKIRERVYNEWDKLTRKIRKSVSINLFREQGDAIRIMIAHSFLNYFNREKKGNTLIVNEEDCDIAIKLMKRDLQTKYKLLLSSKLGKSVKTINDFNKLMKSDNIPSEIKQMIPFYMKEKFPK